jgi:flagellar biosynthesis/type III secretory pathway protein FliH
MKQFCVEKINRDPALLAQHGVLSASALTLRSDARAVAQLIEQQARAEAAALLQQARQEAQRQVEELCRQTTQQATQLLATLERTRDECYLQVEPMVLALAQGAFERLTGALTPQEKIQAVLRRLQQEAPPRLHDAVLRMHPDEMIGTDDVPWSVQADPSLSRGTCRLEAGGGEWRVSFELALAALQDAFASLSRTLAQGV